MSLGRAYLWTPEPSHPLGGTVCLSIVELPRLDDCGERLRGRFVEVRNAGTVISDMEQNGRLQSSEPGGASADAAGDFLFNPCQGGERVDEAPPVPADKLRHYVEASRFGEVNTYYHLDRIAAHIDDLARELDAAPLPRVKAVVNAHHAATEEDGRRDGVWQDERWRPFQGGHYRLPSWRYDIAEYLPLSPQGEIHLGPGWRRMKHGALAQTTGAPYLHNASHNAGTLYHEYGHHINRHTADFRANSLRPPQLQSNRKTATDEGTCDYWAAAMLCSPHIWAWHHRHDGRVIHRRSLVSRKSMADYDSRPEADPHGNGTIWAAALWDLRTRLENARSGGARQTDLLVLQSLFLIGRRTGSQSTARSTAKAREGFSVALAALLEADERLDRGRNRREILETFRLRGVYPPQSIAGLAGVLTQ